MIYGVLAKISRDKRANSPQILFTDLMKVQLGYLDLRMQNFGCGTWISELTQTGFCRVLDLDFEKGKDVVLHVQQWFPYILACQIRTETEHVPFHLMPELDAIATDAPCLNVPCSKTINNKDFKIKHANWVTTHMFLPLKFSVSSKPYDLHT